MNCFQSSAALFLLIHSYYDSSVETVLETAHILIQFNFYIFLIEFDGLTSLTPDLTLKLRKQLEQLLDHSITAQQDTITFLKNAYPLIQIFSKAYNDHIFVSKM